MRSEANTAATDSKPLWIKELKKSARSTLSRHQSKSNREENKDPESSGNAETSEAENSEDAKVADLEAETDDAKAEETGDGQTTRAAIRNGDQTGVQVRVKPHPQFPEIYQIMLEDGAHRLATRNFAPGRNVYGERLIRVEGVEYRVWDAFRSKLAGGILKGLQTVPILPGHKVLYLGAASGTTPSHISDIVGENGHVYCVEFAQRSLRELVTNVVAFRLNMSPFLADARMPQKYSMFISGKVDDIYCDIAQPEQAKVLADNADVFLKEGGWVVHAVKAQSIDVTKEPSEVYQQEAKILRNRGFRVEQVVDLEPYDRAHAMIVAQR
jgi:fibrillarin-like pre-rRNA processing protein